MSVRIKGLRCIDRQLAVSATGSCFVLFSIFFEVEFLLPRCTENLTVYIRLRLVASSLAFGFSSSTVQAKCGPRTLRPRRQQISWYHQLSPRSLSPRLTPAKAAVAQVFPWTRRPSPAFPGCCSGEPLPHRRGQAMGSTSCAVATSQAFLFTT